MFVGITAGKYYTISSLTEYIAKRILIVMTI